MTPEDRIALVRRDIDRATRASRRREAAARQALFATGCAVVGTWSAALLILYVVLS